MGQRPPGTVGIGSPLGSSRHATPTPAALRRRFCFPISPRRGMSKIGTGL
ncbi:hypothetical protein RchiOBHm_Chr4g0424921 [Rosa chinensis]|uniref:Uncharacterized protein n=1 Tax=Rosa chinensis TaxID=74649 RepID=A0A2P6QZ46_ROSCH|nr:hypothetical protein RchiOBHm_Chr4g0424921 [Rosa chinensis]